MKVVIRRSKWRAHRVVEADYLVALSTPLTEDYVAQADYDSPVMLDFAELEAGEVHRFQVRARQDQAVRFVADPHNGEPWIEVRDTGANPVAFRKEME